MDSFQTFYKLRERCGADSDSIDNLTAEGLLPASRPLRVLWMYPDSLSMHGGRGDLMALLRLATAAGLPLSIRRVAQPTDAIPFDEADLLFFCAGELRCVPSLVQAMLPQKEALRSYVAAGGFVFANGSSGALLGKQLIGVRGEVCECLGLLDMTWRATERVFGDDLWLENADGRELLGNQIALAEVFLGEGQKPFATVRYGRGNHADPGDRNEGAVTGNVYYTGCLGPLLVRNPQLAVDLLQKIAIGRGLISSDTILDPGDLSTELAAAEKAKAFIQTKIK